MRKNLFIRVDGSLEIGTGHIIRCITLATELKKFFNDIVFLTKSITGNLIPIIEENGFKVKILDSNSQIISEKIDQEHEIAIINDILNYYGNDSNFLLIDHYEIGKKYESSVEEIFKKIFVIDDLANREHYCHLLIDQNYYENFQKRYEKLVSKKCNTLLGPDYIILRSEFHNFKKINYTQNHYPENILISYGGSDPTNECEKILNAISSLKNKKFNIIVITGINNQNFSRIKKKFGKIPNIKIFQHVNNFSKILSKSELCFGAGGTTTWERLYLDIPSIVTITSSDQKESIEYLSRLGYVINLGLANEVTEKTYENFLLNFNSEKFQKLITKNEKIVDGKGCIRIKQQIEQMIDD